MPVPHALAPLAGPSNAGIAVDAAPFDGYVPPMTRFSNGMRYGVNCRVEREQWIDIIERMGCNQALSQLKKGSHSTFQLIEAAGQVHGNEGGIVNIVVPEVRQIGNCQIEIGLDDSAGDSPQADYFAIKETDIDLAVRFLSNSCDSRFHFPQGAVRGLPGQAQRFPQSGGGAPLEGTRPTSPVHSLKLSINRLEDGHASTDHLSDQFDNTQGPFTVATEVRASPRNLTTDPLERGVSCVRRKRALDPEYTAFSEPRTAQDCGRLYELLASLGWDTFTFAKYDFKGPILGPETVWSETGTPNIEEGRLHWGLPFTVSSGHCSIHLTSNTLLESTKYREVVGVSGWELVRQVLRTIDLQCEPSDLSKEVNVIGRASLPHDFLTSTTGPSYTRVAQAATLEIAVIHTRQELQVMNVQPPFVCEPSWGAFKSAQSRANCIQAWRNLSLKPMEFFREGNGLESTVSDCTVSAKSSDDMELFYSYIGMILDHCTTYYHMGGKASGPNREEFSVYSAMEDKDEEPELSYFDFNTLKDDFKHPRPG